MFRALDLWQVLTPVSSSNYKTSKSLYKVIMPSLYFNSYSHMHTYCVYGILGVFCSYHVCGGESKLEALLLCLSSAIVDEDLRVTWLVGRKSNCCGGTRPFIHVYNSSYLHLNRKARTDCTISSVKNPPRSYLLGETCKSHTKHHHMFCCFSLTTW